MIAVKPTQMRDQFKTLCDMVVRGGETVIVSRPNNENVVVVSEKEYNAMQKAARNTAYFEMIDKSMAELASGGLVLKTHNRETEEAIQEARDIASGKLAAKPQSVDSFMQEMGP